MARRPVPTGRSGWAALAVLLLVGVLTGLVREATDDDVRPSARPALEQTTGSGSAGQAAPDSGEVRDGLPTVPAAALPREARTTLSLIDDGGPFPYDEDGSVFGNREGLLPPEQRGCYREYTVDTPGEDDRGARRIVTSCAGPRYWTADHYEKLSRIVSARL